MTNYGNILFVFCELNRKVYMLRYTILLGSKNKKMHVMSFMCSRAWVQPSSNFLLTKWPTSLVELETPDVYSLIRNKFVL